MPWAGSLRCRSPHRHRRDVWWLGGTGPSWDPVAGGLDVAVPPDTDVTADRVSIWEHIRSRGDDLRAGSVPTWKETVKILKTHFPQSQQ